MTLALVGIGMSPQANDAIFKDIIYSDIISDFEKNQLIKNGAIGDICMRFFNKDGTPVLFNQIKAMSIDLEDLTRIPEVIAAAGGVQKAEAIIGACRAKYINFLITDELTALKILEKVSI